MGAWQNVIDCYFFFLKTDMIEYKLIKYLNTYFS